MKIQLDSSKKIIRVEENVNLGELVKYLDKLLPKDSPIGYWKDFKLETNTVIYNWTNPYYYDWRTNPVYPLSPVYCGLNGNADTILDTGSTITTSVFNLELN